MWRRPLRPKTIADPEAALRAWLRVWTKGHPRLGYRNAHTDAADAGWHVNFKKIQRLWREEGFRVIVRRRRNRVGSSTAEPFPATAANAVWSVDFQFDATWNGRPMKSASIVDEHTCEGSGGLVERSITAIWLGNLRRYGQELCNAQEVLVLRFPTDHSRLSAEETVQRRAACGMTLCRSDADTPIGDCRLDSRAVMCTAGDASCDDSPGDGLDGACC